VDNRESLYEIKRLESEMAAKQKAFRISTIDPQFTLAVERFCGIVIRLAVSQRPVRS
jgi:hypothetical protein